MTKLKGRIRIFDTQRHLRVVVALLGIAGAQSAWAAIIPGDVVAPQITFVQPSPNTFVNTLATIQGSAIDNAGVTDGGSVSSVNIILKRNQDQKYWDGSRWVSTPVLLPTVLRDEQFVYSLGVVWTAPAPGMTLPTGSALGSGTFVITAEATDASGNVSRASETVTADRRPPTLSIITPRNGTVVTNLATRGSARESSSESGVDRVTFTLRRHSDDKYWNGTAWVGLQPESGAFYPPAELLVGSYNNGIIREFRTTTGQPVRDFARNLAHPETILFGPDQDGDGYPELYATDRDNDKVIFYDGRTRRRIGIFARGGDMHDPTGLAFMPKSGPNDLYPDLLVASGFAGDTTTLATTIKRFDGRTRVYKGNFVFAPRSGNGVVSNGYEDIIFGRDANGDGAQDLYAVALIEGKIVVYNGVTGAYIRDFVPAAQSGGLSIPTGATFGPDANGDAVPELYVCSSGSDDIKLYHGVTGAFIGNFLADDNGANFGINGPERLIFGPDNNLYVSIFGTATNNAGDGDAVLRFSISPNKQNGVPNPAPGKSRAIFANDSIPGPAGLAFNPIATGVPLPPAPPIALVAPTLTTNYNGSTGLYERSSALPTGSNLQRGLYTLVVTAVDRAGNSTTLTSTVTVGAAPTVAITTPKNGTTISSLPTIAGTAQGDAVQSVQLFLKRNSDGLFYTGAGWGARTALSTTLTPLGTVNGVNFQRTSGLPSGTDLKDGSYLLEAVATNDLGLSDSALSTFTVETSGGGGTSQVELSQFSATASTSTVRLGFTGALDAAAAAEPARYTLTINGVAVNIERATYSASNFSVLLKVPITKLRSGDSVQVSFDLLDSAGRVLSGQSATVIAGR